MAGIRAENESDIPPALTANEWANIEANPISVVRFLEFAEEIGRTHATIAIANAHLHDEDPRKLTREHVELVREMAGLLDLILAGPNDDVRLSFSADEALRKREQYSGLLELADVVESYLPPSE